MKPRIILILPIVAVMVGVLYYFNLAEEEPEQTAPLETMPDFGAIDNVAQRKEAFFEFMLPKVQHANAEVRGERATVLAISKSLAAGHALTDAEFRLLNDLSSRYRVTPANTEKKTLAELLKRVDTVPASLMLAQSATESAWGRSRFAREGNNFFGIWCFTPGCGMTPRYRDEGLTHEVATFDSVQESVNRYLHTINTNLAYKDLRAIRASKRRHKKPVLGTELAEGLRRYSERGSDYVRDIQQMIRINKLRRFNNPAALQVSDNR